MKKVAFLFLIYDTINCEELWNIFFKNVDKCRYSIYIHYKFNRPLKYFEEYKIKNIVETRYADISLVKAQNALLEEALKDPDNEHFVFVSNSCIPLKPFNHIYKFLNPAFSYFNITPQIQCFPRCDSLLAYVEHKNIQKASQWCILNRKHASIMTGDTTYLHWYHSVYAPDEICYIVNIFHNNLQDEIVTTPNVANGATTFTNWQGMEYPYPSLSGLKNYNTITEEELTLLLLSPCMFGRKFNRECIGSLAKRFYVDAISTKESIEIEHA